MVRRNGFRISAVVMAATAALGTGALVNTAAATPPDPGVIYADVDGDRAIDRISLERAADGMWLARADLASGRTITAPLADDDRIELVGLRATDVNSDGAAEIIAPMSVGANTVQDAMLVHRPDGLGPVTQPDGTELRLAEGGGVAMVNGYGCDADHDGRSLQVVSAALQPDSRTLYDGARVTYLVSSGGVATPTHVTHIVDAERDSPSLETDPASCAPVR